MIDLTDLSRRSGLSPSILHRAFRGGLSAVIIDFAAFVGFHSRCRYFAVELEDTEIAAILDTEIEAFFSRRFGVVGTNPPEREQGTGFELVEEVMPSKTSLPPVWVFTNLRPDKTGLPMTVWVQAKVPRQAHGPRIQVQRTHDASALSQDQWVPVTVEDRPRRLRPGILDADMELVVEFIRLNRDVLEALWCDEIEPAELCRRLRRI